MVTETTKTLEQMQAEFETAAGADVKNFKLIKDLVIAIDKAEKEAEKLKDEYISAEHLFLAFLK